MVVIGFDKKHNTKVSTLLKINCISLRDKIAFSASERVINNNFENICFFEIETKNLIDEWFCCWGGIYQMNLFHEELHTDIHRIEYLQNQIRLFNDDLSFWLDFAKDFVGQFDKLVLFRYYPDVKLPITVEKLTLKELTRDKLLEMECNQIFLITQGNDSLC